MSIRDTINRSYKYNFRTNLDSDILKGGLNKILVDSISIINKDLDIIKNFRINSLNKIYKIRVPDWQYFENPDINYDELVYYSKLSEQESVMEILKNTFEELGFSFEESSILNETSIDFVFDSLSVIKTIKPFLSKAGIIFNSLFESLYLYKLLVISYLGTVVSNNDNFYASLNSIVFSEGSFCYIPRDTECNFNLSTYFRTNTENFAQFERTLLVIGQNSYVFYLEGCTAPKYKETQLHVAVVEIILKKNSIVKYATVQNWFSGNILGEGGLYNFTTKRGKCFENATLEWLQVELGSSITWKYPSTILSGNNSKSEFYSISFVSELQIADTGSKMFHIGNNTSSRVVSKSISFDISRNIYRGLIKIFPVAFNTYNKTECDSLLIGKDSLTVTLPYSKVYNYTSNIQQEAFISKVDEDLVFFLKQRGLNLHKALTLIVNGFCSEIYNKLPLEFISEVPKLVFVKTKNIFN